MATRHGIRGNGREIPWAGWTVRPWCHSVGMTDNAVNAHSRPRADAAREAVTSKDAEAATGNVALQDPGAATGAAGPSPERLGDLLEHQYDVIARRQALKYGLTAGKLRHRLRPDGHWQKILPGVYSTRTGVVTQEQRQMAALLYAGPDAVLTGAWAVRRYRLQCAGLNEADILVPARSRVQSYGWVRIQHTTRMPSGTSSANGIVFAPLARAVADAARRMTRPEATRVPSSARRCRRATSRCKP